MVFSGTKAINTQIELEEARARGEKPTPVEKRMGVYIGEVTEDKKNYQKLFKYFILGHLINEDYLAPLDEMEKEYLADPYDRGEPLLQNELLISAINTSNSVNNKLYY